MTAPTDPFANAALAEGVPSAFTAVRDGIDAILRDRGMRRTSPEQTADSLHRGAEATAALEDESDATREAAIRLSTELLGLLPAWNRAPVQALARMHALAAAGSVPDDDLGRPVNPDGARRLADLGRMCLVPTAAPGLVVAALVHAEITAAGAFSSHNGVVARAAERLILVAKGVDPASLTVPEAGHAAAPAAYRAALAAYAGPSSVGVTQWLLYAADAFSRGAEASPLAQG